MGAFAGMQPSPQPSSDVKVSPLTGIHSSQSSSALEADSSSVFRRSFSPTQPPLLVRQSDADPDAPASFGHPGLPSRARMRSVLPPEQGLYAAQASPSELNVVMPASAFAKGAQKGFDEDMTPQETRHSLDGQGVGIKSWRQVGDSAYHHVCYLPTIYRNGHRHLHHLH